MHLGNPYLSHLPLGEYLLKLKPLVCWVAVKPKLSNDIHLLMRNRKSSLRRIRRASQQALGNDPEL